MAALANVFSVPAGPSSTSTSRHERTVAASPNVDDDTESARIHARAEADDLGPGADQAHDVEVDVDEPRGEGSP